MNAPETSFQPFDDLVASLRADGLGEDADRLNLLLHGVAWTTGSELLGELGQEMKRIEAASGGGFSARTESAMGRAFEAVARAWPDFRR